MSTVYVTIDHQLSAGLVTSQDRTTRLLLVSGIFAALLYVAMNIIVPMQWPAYNSWSQTISELSAVDAPTRDLWVSLGLLYMVLATLFGWGVTRATHHNRALHAAGGLLVVFALLGLLWPFAPMHLRGAEPTFTDTMHIVLGVASVLTMLLVVGLGVAGTRGRMRTYSMWTLLMMLVSGVLVAIDAPRIASNEPTPLIGFWERVFIGAFLAWSVVLATKLLRQNRIIALFDA